MATIDQQFVEYIVKTLVNNPDQVSVDRKIDEKGVLLSLTVAPEDVGRVIGRKGATAQSLRVLLRALGTKQDARFNLKIVNTDEEETGARHQRAASETAAEALGETTEHEEQPDLKDEDVENDESEENTEEDSSDTSELAEKTRAELADLDDLDI